MKPNPKSIDAILTMLRAGKDPDTGQSHITEAEAKADLKKLIMSSKPKEKKDGLYSRTWLAGYATGTKDWEQAIQDIFDGKEK